MIVIFGKGKVGNGVAHLLSLLSFPYFLMDDGDFNDSYLKDCDTILVSPGIKQSHRIYQEYGFKIKSELNFLGSLLPSIPFLKNPTWIGITATNGKSTTTWITYFLFKQLLPTTNIWITGNFDIPISEILARIIENKQLGENHLFVVECSSFMLYGLEDFIFDYGVFLNIARDHLDWHRNFEEYKCSKCRLIKCSHTGLVSNLLYPQLETCLQQDANIFYPKFDLSKTQFLGVHNQENFAAVLRLFELYFKNQLLDFDLNHFYSLLKIIPPLDHRLKLLRMIEGISFYDDGICTSSQALHAALNAFSQKLVLIAGGYDKGDDYTWLDSDFTAKVSFVFLFGQTAYKLQSLCKKNHIPFLVVDSLHDAVLKSYEHAKENHIEIVLFSPGAASFDMFKNAYDRSEQFVNEVNLLK